MWSSCFHSMREAGTRWYSTDRAVPAGLLPSRPSGFPSHQLEPLRRRPGCASGVDNRVVANNPDPTIRFAVGTADGPQSLVWRLWVHGSDVYLMPRAARRWKMSFHQSGHCHWAFATEQDLLASADDRAASRARGRFPDVWNMAAPFAPGWRRAFTIIVPMSELSLPKSPRATADVVWVEPAGPHGAVNFAILFGPPHVRPPEVPSARGLPSQWLFGTTLADDSGSAWLMAYAEAVLPDGIASHLERTRRALAAADRRARLNEMPDPTGFAFGTVDDDGGRFYLEIAPSADGRNDTR